MLQLFAHDWLKVIRDLERLTSITDMDAVNALLLGQQKNTLIDTLSQIVAVCESMKLDLSASYGREIIERTRCGHALSKPPFGPKEFQQEILILRKRIDDEIEERTFLMISKDKVRYFDEPWLSFGQEVVEKWVCLSKDIEEAGKCYAMQRNTACVYHLMRIMEVGLKELAQSVGVSDTARNWEAILVKIEGELRRKYSEKTDDWKKAEPFMSEVASHLRTVKTAWRNPTMHVENKYTEEEALEIYSAVRIFMRHLVKNLGTMKG